MSYWKNELKLRRLFTGISLAVLFVHFSLTSLYTVPPLPAPEAFKSLSRKYMYPAFHQGWQLFAPDVPHHSTSLYYKCFSEGAWSDWCDSSKMPKTMGHPRVKYVSRKISMVLNNAMSNEKTRIYYVDGKPRYDKVSTSMGYLQALYFCAMQFKHKSTVLPDSVQLRMEYNITPDFYSGEKPMDDMTFIFPPQSTN